MVATVPAPPAPALDASSAAALPVDDVLARLGSTVGGLSAAEAARRLATFGPNAVRSHRARPWPVLLRQVRSPLLLLLAATALLSGFFGEVSDAVIISTILVASVGLGFVNEYRAERASEALHDQISHTSVVVRDGTAGSTPVDALVPGDIVHLELGEVVPADVRLLDVQGLECDESVLTGESMAAEKQVGPVASGSAMADLSSAALMGSVVHAGSGTAVVVSTGARAILGGIASALGTRAPETEFQVGLRKFSMLLVRVAGVLTTSIFVVNLVLHRPLLDSLLFSLAIAVGITPQLLPAVVSTSLAAGSRRLARKKVLVKRLVCIEDLGDIDVLFTDKTGTLTQGHISFMRSLDAAGVSSPDPFVLGLLCNEAVVDPSGHAVGGNALDVALWESPVAAKHSIELAAWTRLAIHPFDHERRLASVVVSRPGEAAVVVAKGAPEAVLARCVDVPGSATAAVEAEFAAGNRVIAVATREVSDPHAPVAELEQGLRIGGFLVFLDPPKVDAAAALARLGRLGITVKIVTGDNPTVAARVCQELGLPVLGTLTGPDLDALGEDELTLAIQHTTVFARVSPEHKARIVRAERRTGADVAFLGDGVNDAVALHAADVGISVDTGSDVAKDAADVILLAKDLDVLADGVIEGRRIFANTIKYVLMGTSSNFGNMFSAAGASLFLSFLPMLPSQILLNNLLYDTSQLAIPTDEVDAEQLAKPSRWDLGLIQRFMLLFGPVSSVFDVLTFVVMLRLFHAGPALFRSGWFVESLATQTLVIFVIRTRRVPFFRSLPSRPLLLSAIGVVLVGAVLPATPLAHLLGFAPLPGAFFVTLLGMIVVYLAIAESAKRWFYRNAPKPEGPPPPRSRPAGYRRLRRAARFTTSAEDLGRQSPAGVSRNTAIRRSAARRS